MPKAGLPGDHVVPGQVPPCPYRGQDLWADRQALRALQSCVFTPKGTRVSKSGTFRDRKRRGLSTGLREIGPLFFSLPKHLRPGQVGDQVIPNSGPGDLGLSADLSGRWL